MSVVSINPATRKSHHRWLRVVVGVASVAIVMATAIAWRVAQRPLAPGWFDVAAWQLAVWLPWVGYYYVARWLVGRVGAFHEATKSGLLQHFAAALAVAASHLVWYWQVSSNASPLLGLPETKYGVYAFFFVFWVLFDLVLYAAVCVFPSRAKGHAVEPDFVATQRFAVRSGRSDHLVWATDIRWIEAQGSYVALHTGKGSFLLRRSMTRLEEELDSDRFVRVHRSTIVNISQVTGIKRSESGSVSVMLNDGTCRRVSRNGQQKLRSALPSAA